MQCLTGPCQSAHDGPNRYSSDFSGLLVGDALDADQGDDRSLLVRKLAERRVNRSEGQLPVGVLSAVRPWRRLHDINVHDLTTNLYGPHAIDPDVLRDSVQPRIQTRARLPALDARQGTQACVLNKLVTLIRTAR